MHHTAITCTHVPDEHNPYIHRTDILLLQNTNGEKI